jgi:hypothetical protein
MKRNILFVVFAAALMLGAIGCSAGSSTPTTTQQKAVTPTGEEVKGGAPTAQTADK